MKTGLFFIAKAFAQITYEQLELIKQKNSGIAQNPIRACWQCKNAGSYQDCIDNGRYQACHYRQDSCMLEIRRYQNTDRITTGCIPKRSCDAAMRQNFVGPFLWRTQCRPETSRLWSARFGEAICRQCFNICDAANSPENCFGVNGIPLGTSPETYWDALNVKSRSSWSTAVYNDQNTNLAG